MRRLKVWTVKLCTYLKIKIVQLQVNIELGFLLYTGYRNLSAHLYYAFDYHLPIITRNTRGAASIPDAATLPELPYKLIYFF